MGDAGKKKKEEKALYYILFILNCFTDSTPKIFYSFKEEDTET